MNKRYLFEGKTTKAVVEYGADGTLLSLKMDGTEEGRLWFLEKCPFDVTSAMEFGTKTGGIIKVTEMPPDLSFIRFWDTYDYKVGKKEKVIQLWQVLSEADRAKVLATIPRYKHWLAQKPNMEKLYPQTFLSQRRWENEFRL